MAELASLVSPADWDIDDDALLQSTMLQLDASYDAAKRDVQREHAVARPPLPQLPHSATSPPHRPAPQPACQARKQ